MKSLHLKNLPDEVRERLERLAQREHMSVSAFAVRELTELSRRADNPDLLGALPDSEVRVEDILADLMDDRELGRQAVVWPVPQNREIGIKDFSRDPHAVKYQGELQAHPDAFNRLFALLNDPANEQRLVDAEMLDLPALTGVVRFIEADLIIAHTLKSDQGVNRFRQTVGIAVRLKMEKLGWRKTGKKSTVRGSRYFTKAERYINETPSHICTELALEGLKAVSQIGDEHERAQTGRELMEALAAERRKEGRSF